MRSIAALALLGLIAALSIQLLRLRGIDPVPAGLDLAVVPLARSCALVLLAAVASLVIQRFSDGVANGEETDVDCGGPACGKCGNLLFCTANDHCLSGVCTLGACSLPNCQDGVANGLEVRAGAPLPGTG